MDRKLQAELYLTCFTQKSARLYTADTLSKRKPRTTLNSNQTLENTFEQ